MPRRTSVGLVCAASVAAVLIAGTSGGVAWAKKPPVTRPTTTLPRQLALGVPGSTRPRAQVTVGTDRDQAPIAVGNGRVWIGTAGGIAAVDPAGMQTIRTIAISLPTLVIATSSDAVWVLSGSNSYSNSSDNVDLPLYHLSRVDPIKLSVTFEMDLPFHSSNRANRHVRLAASSRAVWVAFKVDPATGRIVRSVDVSTSGLPGSSDGYTSPPFAVGNGQIWSAFRGLQRTTP